MVGIGFTVTKRLGNAVTRNRIRRRLKEAVKLTSALDKLESRNLVIVAKQSALTCDFASLVQKLEEGFQAELRRRSPCS